MTLGLPDPGLRLSPDLNIKQAINNFNQSSRVSALTAVGTTQATALQLKAVINEITTATSSTGVNLPDSGGPTATTPCQFCVVINNGANAITVYAAQGKSDTINGVAGATGVSQGVGAVEIYVSAVKGKWVSLVGTTLGDFVTTTGTQTLTNKTLTNPIITVTPQAGGSTLAVTAAMTGKTILLDTAAGTTATLPAATGTGNTYNFVVSATASSNAHKILAASSSDFLNGIVTGENAGTAKCFASAASTNHSLQMPFAGTQPSGGFIGDWFTVTDIATNLWTVKGMYQAGTTPTTPFSAATS